MSSEKMNKVYCKGCRHYIQRQPRFNPPSGQQTNNANGGTVPARRKSCRRRSEAATKRQTPAGGCRRHKNNTPRAHTMACTRRASARAMPRRWRADSTGRKHHHRLQTSPANHRLLSTRHGATRAKIQQTEYMRLRGHNHQTEHHTYGRRFTRRYAPRRGRARRGKQQTSITTRFAVDYHQYTTNIVITDHHSRQNTKEEARELLFAGSPPDHLHHQRHHHAARSARKEGAVRNTDASARMRGGARRKRAQNGVARQADIIISLHALRIPLALIIMTIIARRRMRAFYADIHCSPSIDHYAPSRHQEA